MLRCFSIKYFCLAYDVRTLCSFLFTTLPDAKQRQSLYIKLYRRPTAVVSTQHTGTYDAQFADTSDLALIADLSLCTGCYKLILLTFYGGPAAAVR